MMFKAAPLLLSILLAVSGCSKKPDADRVQELFSECMKEAKDASIIARALSPTDECHRYAIDVATLEANQ